MIERVPSRELFSALVGGMGILFIAVAHGGAGQTPETGIPDVDSPWPPSAVERMERYGDYVVRVWKSVDETAPSYYRLVTVDLGDERLVCLDWAAGLGRLSGQDIDGSGYPNLVIESYSGGAHCCFETFVYDLAETFLPISLPASPEGNAPGEFVDLDGDSVFEFRTRDDSFAYAYCAFAGSAAVLVILEVSSDEGRYLPRSYAYPQLYRSEIRLDTERAKLALTGGGDAGWDGTPKCDVLPLVLDYLYSGDPRRRGMRSRPTTRSRTGTRSAPRSRPSSVRARTTRRPPTSVAPLSATAAVAPRRATPSLVNLQGRPLSSDPQGRPLQPTVARGECKSRRPFPSPPRSPIPADRADCVLRRTGWALGVRVR